MDAQAATSGPRPKDLLNFGSLMRCRSESGMRCGVSERVCVSGVRRGLVSCACGLCVLIIRCRVNEHLVFAWRSLINPWLLNREQRPYIIMSIKWFGLGCIRYLTSFVP
jgi:hypothetical protein